MKRVNSRKERPQLLKNRQRQVERLTGAAPKDDDDNIKAQWHGFEAPLQHFKPDAVEERIQKYLADRKT